MKWTTVGDCRTQHAQQCVHMVSRESMETQLGTIFLNALKALNHCHQRAMRIAVDLGHPVLDDLGFRVKGFRVVGLGFRVEGLGLRAQQSPGLCLFSFGHK